MWGGVGVGVGGCGGGGCEGKRVGMGADVCGGVSVGGGGVCVGGWVGGVGWVGGRGMGMWGGGGGGWEWGGGEGRGGYIWHVWMCGRLLLLFLFYLDYVVLFSQGFICDTGAAVYTSHSQCLKGHYLTV